MINVAFTQLSRSDKLTSGNICYLERAVEGNEGEETFFPSHLSPFNFCRRCFSLAVPLFGTTTQFPAFPNLLAPSPIE